MDYDTYSANDAIGRVHLDCNILVERMRWQEVRHLEEQFTMPIYDTINGLRGELVFQVSIHLLIPYDYTNYVQMLSGKANTLLSPIFLQARKSPLRLYFPRPWACCVILRLSKILTTSG